MAIKPIKPIKAINNFDKFIILITSILATLIFIIKIQAIPLIFKNSILALILRFYNFKTNFN